MSKEKKHDSIFKNIKNIVSDLKKIEKEIKNGEISDETFEALFIARRTFKIAFPIMLKEELMTQEELDSVIYKLDVLEAYCYKTVNRIN